MKANMVTVFLQVLHTVLTQTHETAEAGEVLDKCFRKCLTRTFRKRKSWSLGVTLTRLVCMFAWGSWVCVCVCQMNPNTLKMGDCTAGLVGMGFTTTCV